MTKPFDRARSIYEEIKVRVYGPLGSETPTCAEALTTAGLIAELQNRVEALEAAAKPVESNYSDEPVALFESADDRQRWMERQLEKPDSSLVERVAIVCAMPAKRTWDDQARAAILAVADWSEQQGLRTAADWLRQEVNQ